MSAPACNDGSASPGVARKLVKNSWPGIAGGANPAVCADRQPQSISGNPNGKLKGLPTVVHGDPFDHSDVR